MFGKVLCQVFRWLGPEGEKIEDKIEDGEENRFGVVFCPFRTGSSGVRPEVPAKRENG